MILTTRIIFSQFNTTLSDFGIKLQNYKSGSEVMAFIASEDALYIGSDHPFNHRYFQIKTANSNLSSVSVELWDSSSWNPVAEITDETSASGASLSGNGIITWVPARNKNWSKEDTTLDIPELNEIEIYDKYWARFKWSEDLSATTELEYIGQKFSSDDDLQTIYPSLVTSDQLLAFQDAKTNWDEQHIEAGKLIVDDLIDKGVAWNEGQIIDIEKFRAASVHRVAMIAFREYGTDYEKNLAVASADYVEAFERAVYNLDKNRNARLEMNEQISDMRVIRR